MIYLLYGEDAYAKKNKLNEILQEASQNSINWIENEEVEWLTIIQQCQTNSLLSDKQAFIIDNFQVTSDFEKKHLPLLEDYLANPNPDTILIFNASFSEIEKRKKFFKLINNKGTIYNFPKQTNIFHASKKMLGDLKISDQDLHYLISIVGNNLGMMENEIIKLKNYQPDGQITQEIIDKVCSKYQEPNLFALIDAIINKDIKQAFAYYQILIKYNEEPIKIIISVANQLRLIYQVKSLKKAGYANQEIAKKLNVHPYRVKLALAKGREYSEKQIMFLLNQLADFDIAIKSGKIDKDLAFEYFLLNLEKQV